MRPIESRPAQPIDRTVAADQGCGFAVPDHRIIFDAQCHGPPRFKPIARQANSSSSSDERLPIQQRLHDGRTFATGQQAGLNFFYVQVIPSLVPRTRLFLDRACFTSLERRGIALCRSACARTHRPLFRADRFQSWDARRSIPKISACLPNPPACRRPSLEAFDFH